MGHVVVNRELLLDHFGDALKRPEVRRVAMSTRTSKKELAEAGSLSVRQSRFASTASLRSKSLLASLAKELPPARHRGWHHTDAMRDLADAKPTLQKNDCRSSADFQRRLAASGFHVYSYRHGVINSSRDSKDQ